MGLGLVLVEGVMVSPSPNPTPNPRVGGSTGSKAEMLRKTVACTASAASTCLGWG